MVEYPVLIGDYNVQAVKLPLLISAVLVVGYFRPPSH